MGKPFSREESNWLFPSHTKMVVEICGLCIQQLATWKIKVNGFHKAFNNQCNSIKFTIEKHENNFLMFLDVLATKKDDGSLTHQVYMKKTHTDRYLHADPHQHVAHNIEIIDTFPTRALRISGKENLKDELKHLKLVLISNGYKGKPFKKNVVLQQEIRGKTTL